MRECGFRENRVRQFLETYYSGAIDPALLKDARYAIVRCGECGFLWQKHVLDAAGLQTLYETWIRPEASKEKRVKADVSLSVAYAREMLILQKLIGKSPQDMRVLDVGMGWGYWCLMAKAFRFSVLGIEISELRRAHALSLGISSLQLEDLSLHQFDGMNCEQTFEHLADPRGVGLRLARALRIGGVLRIAVPDAGKTLPRLLRADWVAAKDAFQPLEHINCFTHATLLRFGASLGLERIARPLFPLIAHDIPALLRSVLAPVYYHYRGTILYFRKVREPPEE